MRVRDSMLTALLGAVICVLSPWMLPAGPVPVTLATLGVYLAVGLLGTKRGTAAVGLYVALGAVGAPVFSGFTGGLQRLTGVTGGYIWGYLLCALLAGLLIRCLPRRWGLPAAFTAGTVALYAVGTLWYVWQTGTPMAAALLLCVVPFLPADGVKIAVATLLCVSLRRPLERMSSQSWDKE